MRIILSMILCVAGSEDHGDGSGVIAVKLRLEHYWI
jgi:hypothetical protein